MLALDYLENLKIQNHNLILFIESLEKTSILCSLGIKNYCCPLNMKGWFEPVVIQRVQTAPSFQALIRVCMRTIFLPPQF